MVADHPGRCAQRGLIVPAKYSSGTADPAFIVEKVDPINDHLYSRCANWRSPKVNQKRLGYRLAGSEALSSITGPRRMGAGTT
jgi:hypothetical protein